MDPAESDQVAVAGIRTPPAIVRAFPWIHDLARRLKRERKDHRVRLMLDRAALLNARSGHRRDLSATELAVPHLLLARLTRLRAGGIIGPRARILFVEHHHAHAAGAAVLSGFDSALCLTADGMGDGLSLTVSRYRKGTAPERLWCIPAQDSFGLFFEALTEAFGFVPCRDEGKLTGLAAYGSAARVAEPLPFHMDPEVKFTATARPALKRSHGSSSGCSIAMPGRMSPPGPRRPWKPSSRVWPGSGFGVPARTGFAWQAASLPTSN